MTTVTDVMILNYVVGLDVARHGTQCNTQGMWPCKLPIDSLPLQLFAMSPDRLWGGGPHESLAQTATSKLSKNSCMVTHDKKESLMSVMKENHNIINLK